jgi:hypothetical protein
VWIIDVLRNWPKDIVWDYHNIENLLSRKIYTEDAVGQVCVETYGATLELMQKYFHLPYSVCELIFENAHTLFRVVHPENVAYLLEYCKEVLISGPVVSEGEKKEIYVITHKGDDFVYGDFSVQHNTSDKNDYVLNHYGTYTSLNCISSVTYETYDAAFDALKKEMEKNPNKYYRIRKVTTNIPVMPIFEFV